MYKRVLVPLDGSAVAEAILPFTLQIAGPLGLEVVLLRVVPSRPVPAVDRASYSFIDDIRTATDEAHAYLTGIVRELDARGLRVNTSVRYGEPAQEIARAAAEAGADLIVMTTHGRSGLGRLLFGSVAEAVLRRADIPVFFMRFTEHALSAEETPWRRTA